MDIGAEISPIGLVETSWLRRFSKKQAIVARVAIPAAAAPTPMPMTAVRESLLSDECTGASFVPVASLDSVGSGAAVKNLAGGNPELEGTMLAELTSFEADGDNTRADDTGADEIGADEIEASEAKVDDGSADGIAVVYYRQQKGSIRIRIIVLQQAGQWMLPTVPKMMQCHSKRQLPKMRQMLLIKIRLILLTQLRRVAKSMLLMLPSFVGFWQAVSGRLETLMDLLSLLTPVLQVLALS